MKFYRYPVDIPPAYITWGFGAVDKSIATGLQYQHRGIDIGCPVGTPMFSPGAGTVYEHRGDGSFGLNVAIAHDEGYYSIMAHMSNPIVSPGDIVKPGQLVGYSGNTGLSTGPHVHWQVCLDSWFPRDISRSRDPASFLVNEPIPEEDEMNSDQLARMERLERIVGGPAADGIDLLVNINDLNTALTVHVGMPHSAADGVGSHEHMGGQSGPVAREDLT